MTLAHLPRRRVLLAAIGLPVVAALPGCAAVDPRVYARDQPALDLKRYFDGMLDGWGMVQDRFGKVLRRFTVTMQASWQGDTGTLDEAFAWSDGERQRRVWTLRAQPAGRYIGTAADVIGEAIGHAAGNALNWRYAMAVPVGGRVLEVDFDDWMFLVDEKVLLNRATMSKFGIRLGEVTLSLTRR
ncbi:MAG TPA: DUF3833 domain-containing protein [Burkholderiaceae bacterium]|jgi:hypothetical protein|nr:DUF3833 domain-containing protein [Burkholderiaceae bacterium]